MCARDVTSLCVQRLRFVPSSFTSGQPHRQTDSIWSAYMDSLAKSWAKSKYSLEFVRKRWSWTTMHCLFQGRQFFSRHNGWTPGWPCNPWRHAGQFKTLVVRDPRQHSDVITTLLLTSRDRNNGQSPAPLFSATDPCVYPVPLRRGRRACAKRQLADQSGRSKFDCATLRRCDVA